MIISNRIANKDRIDADRKKILMCVKYKAKGPVNDCQSTKF